MEVRESIPDSAWRPKATPLTGDSFQDVLSNEEDIAVHFWAAWNQYESEMDKLIQKLEPRLSGWITFYSCNIDDPLNVELCKELGVVSVPCLLVFRSGKKQAHIIGLRDEMELAAEVLEGLTRNSRTSKAWWKFW